MARGREQAGPTQWVVDCDEVTLVLYVTVTQTMGTRAGVKLQEHHLRDDASERPLSSYRGDSKDQGLDHLLFVAKALLEAARLHEQVRLERALG